MKSIPEINEPEFEAEVLKSKQPVLVSFWAEWSHACHIVERALGEAADGHPGNLKVVKVNVDDNPELGMWYGIQCIPTLLYFIDGNVAAKIVGTASKETILNNFSQSHNKNKAQKK